MEMYLIYNRKKYNSSHTHNWSSIVKYGDFAVIMLCFNYRLYNCRYLIKHISFDQRLFLENFNYLRCRNYGQSIHLYHSWIGWT